jgi:hypothetical protein
MKTWEEIGSVDDLVLPEEKTIIADVEKKTIHRCSRWNEGSV